MRRITHGLSLAGALAGALATTGCDQAVVSSAGALATGQRGITAITSDGFFVYWSMSNGAIKRVSIDGGEPVTLVDAQPGAVSGESIGASNLKVDADTLYWTTASAVMRAPKAGGSPIALAGEMEPLSDLTGLAQEDADDFVYFTRGSGLVHKAPKIPGAMETLASAEDTPHAPVVRGTSLYWATGASGQAGSVRLMNAGAGSPATVPGSAAPIDGITVDDSNVYWASSNAVSWVSLAGGDPSVIQTGDFAVPAIVADATNLYWSSLTGAVSTAPVVPNATPEVLVTGPAGLVSLAIDLTGLYWANKTDGSVFTMPKVSSIEAM